MHQTRQIFALRIPARRKEDGLQWITFTPCVRKKRGRRHERAGEMNWMLFFLSPPQEDDGIWRLLSQVIHGSALSKELSTTWDEQWHCDCRDGRALDWKISATCSASFRERRPNARGGKRRGRWEVGKDGGALTDENQSLNPSTRVSREGVPCNGSFEDINWTKII